MEEGRVQAHAPVQGEHSNNLEKEELSIRETKRGKGVASGMKSRKKVNNGLREHRGVGVNSKTEKKKKEKKKEEGREEKGMSRSQL